MLFRRSLTYHEVELILDMKNTDGEKKAVSFSPGSKEVREIKITFKTLSPENGEVDFTVSDNTVKSVMTMHNNKNGFAKIIGKFFFLQ